MTPIDWERQASIPPGPAALLAALQFGSGENGGRLLQQLDSAAWSTALQFSDRAQLRLLVGHLLTQHLPAPLQERLRQDRARNASRMSALYRAFDEIADTLETRALPYLVLKGFTHDVVFADEPQVRPQYDIDLYAPDEHLRAIRDVLLSLGYEPLTGLAGLPLDHMPTMVRKTGWEWRGDLFDPEIPPSVDLHFRFWDDKTEHIPVPELDRFWSRRVAGSVRGRQVAMLDPADRLAYAALHLLRHVLRGSVRVYHVYELAYFLNRHCHADRFWSRWQDLHPPEMRSLEAVAFALAYRWFGGTLPAVPRQEIESLPRSVRTWMDVHGDAPLAALFEPNKSELWLHLALIESNSDRLRVMRRRLLPLRLPGPVSATFVSEQDLTWKVRMERTFRWLAHIGVRVQHHARTLIPTIAEGLTWTHPDHGLALRQFLLLLCAANIYAFGIFILFLLYNLFLLDAGYRENSLGIFSGAMTLGTIAGALPAAALCHRVGIRASLVAGCIGVAAFSACRTIHWGDLWLAATAFGAGCASSLWMIALMPAVAAILPDRHRPTAFSLWIGSGIATGSVAGLLGSRLPAWIAAAGLAADTLTAKRIAIIIGCALALCALWPLSRLTCLSGRAEPEPKTYPNEPFVWRYLFAFGLWQFAVGMFNPLFNAYFFREAGASIEQIGNIFAGSQLAQVAALAVAPLILGKAGVIEGTAVIQAAGAACLVAIATGLPPFGVAVGYAAFMSCQAMVEPGMFSALMNRVAHYERSGASGLNFFVMFGAQAIAAAVGGWLVTQAGYAAMLHAAGAVALVSALFFRLLLKSERISHAEVARASGESV
jgi:MFS family permease